MQKPSILKFLNRKPSMLLYASIGFAILASLFGLFFSSVHIPFDTIIHVIAHKIFNLSNKNAFTLTQEIIIWEIRLPRVVIALLVGASLSLAGATLQGILRNPLADPYTIGVSSGASIFAVLVIFFKWSLFGMGIMMTVSIMSIIGSIFTLFIVIGLANLSNTKLSNETIILSGIIISSFINAGITLLISLSNKDGMGMIMYWMMGSLSMKTWSNAMLIIPFFCIGSAYLLIKTKIINALSIGESSAYHLGINVQREKVFLLIAISILTGSAVAITGAIGFVGLIIPHFVRLILGSNNKYIMPISMFIGGGYLALTDVIARTIIEPSELPIGVITALLGAPLFTWILIQNRRGKVGL